MPHGLDSSGRACGWAWLCVAAMGCDAAHEALAPYARDAGADAAVEPCSFSKQLWTLEDETIVVPLVCADGQVLDAQHVQLLDAPDGMALDRERAELRWRPSLAQAANYRIELALPRGGHGVVQIGVADRFEHPDNVPIVDPSRYTHELGLSVFHLSTADDINDADYTAASVMYAGEPFLGAEAKYRGATSNDYPKRSLTLKFDKSQRFSDAELGFRGSRRLVLTSTFDDNSQIRQRLAFELWNALDTQHIPIQHFNAVVYLNGHYHGVYVVTDHLDDDFLEALGYPSTVNMYKARLKDANFRLTDRDGVPKKRLREGYTKEEGYPPAGDATAYDELEALVSWVATASDEDFREQVSARLAPDFENWFILVTLSAAVDTTTKNYFLVHDARPDAPDSRWRFVPWDFNASFGQSYRTLRRGPERYEVARLCRSNRMFERLTNDPALRQQLMQRFHTAVESVGSAEQISLAFERFAQEVSVAATRDELRWNEASRAYFDERPDFFSHDEEISYLRAWLPARWSMVAAQLD